MLSVWVWPVRLMPVAVTSADGTLMPLSCIVSAPFLTVMSPGTMPSHSPSMRERMMPVPSSNIA